MNNLESKFYFVVETVKTTDAGTRLNKLTADSDGYYNDVPLMALNRPTMGAYFYDPASIVTQITSAGTLFNHMLTTGVLYGEYDHPEVRTREDFNRLREVKKEKVSHHFRKVYSSQPLADGTVLVLGSIKPCGPYGQYLKENLEDPNMNTAFSIRSLCEEKTENGKIVRYVRLLVTFDAVSAPGYKEATKSYSPSNIGTESYKSPELTVDDLNNIVTGIGMEHLSLDTTELKKYIFGQREVVVSTRKFEVKGLLDKDRLCLRTDSGTTSLYHLFFRP